ncbi:MalM family protein [Serratia ureilytica]
MTLSSLAKTPRCTRRAWCWMSICARRRITRAAFPAQPPGAMSSDRLEGTLSGRRRSVKNRYLLVYTTRRLGENHAADQPGQGLRAGRATRCRISRIRSPARDDRHAGSLR